MTKRNMKIEINESQPLDEVVEVLHKLGFDPIFVFSDCEFIIIKTNMTYCGIDGDIAENVPSYYKLTTLDELRRM